MISFTPVRTYFFKNSTLLMGLMINELKIKCFIQGIHPNLTPDPTALELSENAVKTFNLVG